VATKDVYDQNTEAEFGEALRKVAALGETANVSEKHDRWSSIAQPWLRWQEQSALYVLINNQVSWLWQKLRSAGGGLRRSAAARAVSHVLQAGLQ
jgi:hypothetical protein